MYKVWSFGQTRDDAGSEACWEATSDSASITEISEWKLFILFLFLVTRMFGLGDVSQATKYSKSVCLELAGLIMVCFKFN